MKVNYLLMKHVNSAEKLQMPVVICTEEDQCLHSTRWLYMKIVVSVTTRVERQVYPSVKHMLSIIFHTVGKLKENCSVSVRSFYLFFISGLWFALWHAGTRVTGSARRLLPLRREVVSENILQIRRTERKVTRALLRSINTFVLASMFGKPDF